MSLGTQVEDQLYSVTRQAFVEASPVFRDMYLVGDSGSGEGATEDQPIVLEGYKACDFEALLTVLYPT